MIALNILLAVVAAVVLLSVALLFCFVSGTEFRDGEIHECVGCRGGELKECPGCRYNPKYWDGMTYTGPSRREMRKLRKETRI